MPTWASTAISRPAFCRWRARRKSRVEIFSLSKSFNMAGWRVGFCLGNKKLIGALARIKSYLDYGIFQPIQIASIIALRECAGGHRKDPRDVSEAARRADPGARPRGLAGGTAARDHVRVGAGSRAVARAAGRSSFPSCCWRKRWWRSRRASASARWAKASCASRWWRTTIG